MQKNNINFNTQRIGIISGLLIPVIIIVGFFIYKSPDNISAFFDEIIRVGIISELVSLCVIPNLLLFFIFMWTNRLQSGRGVIGATFIYVIVVLILKSFL